MTSTDLDFIRLVVDGDVDEVARRLAGNPTLAATSSAVHYAADANRWNPIAQAETIEYLLSVGADPNAWGRPGVSPLQCGDNRSRRARPAGASGSDQ